jgi:DNA-3-methyladenine glycosylase
VHHCLNAITGPPGTPGCVLIRALEPLEGVATMLRRRGTTSRTARLASGPGNLTRALGVTLRDNGTDLTTGLLVVLPAEGRRDVRIARGPRVGITRSMDLPLRFWIAGHPSVSGVRRAREASARTASGRRAGRRE